MSKLSKFSTCSKGHKYWVAGYATDGKCPRCRELDTPTSTAEEAVLRAAEALVGGDRQTITGTLPPGYVAVREADYRALQEALRALRQPQAKRPEEVPVGSLVEHASTIWRMGAFGGRRVLISESGWRVVELGADARVIPLESE